ncbi:IPT/TIG domain-containing protein [Saccharicrinis aurantiacus]|uniref:IPT/TIG domain-containing protein n=1 Tax=Saccharicrinis aurantiacus TaxID=1849719 RepID=UPI0024931C38|nr:IPT/TIG domain-containing protein [Saccharicrinis aurantiacus]
MKTQVIYALLFGALLMGCSKDNSNAFDNDETIPEEAPIINNFFPKEGREGTYVNITGNYFSTKKENNKVYFNGVLGNVYSANDTVIHVEVPAEVSTGILTVQVGNQVDTAYRDFELSTNPWLRKKSIPTGRDGAVAFSINNYGYVGLGYSVSTYYNDMWKYDRIYNTWTPIKDFPGTKRTGCIAFSAGNNGYVGMGQDQENLSTVTVLGDLWKYNAEADEWKQMADIPGEERRNAIAFGCNGNGYVGLGYKFGAGHLKDFWKYNTTSDSWEQLANYPGEGSENSVGFVIGDYIYIGCGTDTKAQNDFWKYDTTNDTWTKVANFGGGTRAGAVGFTLNGNGYVGTGGTQNIYDSTKDFWKYEPSSDKWTQVTDFYGGYRESIGWEDGRRVLGVAFTIDNYAYVGTGDGYIHSRQDIWEYIEEK